MSTELEMKRKNIIIVLPLLLAPDPTIQKTPPSAQDTDLSVSPSKGPADAPVEIAVFSCFE